MTRGEETGRIKQLIQSVLNPYQDPPVYESSRIRKIPFKELADAGLDLLTAEQLNVRIGK